jgi:hypothetical protein
MRSVLLIAPLLLCAGPAAAQIVAAPVQSIALYSYGFNPTPIVLNAGKAVTLSFVNRAGKSHDFTAEKFFRASKIISGRVGEGEVPRGRPLQGSLRAPVPQDARNAYGHHRPLVGPIACRVSSRASA